MEQGTASNSARTSGSVDMSRVLDVKPLKCLVPVFPSASGMSPVGSPQPSPFVCVPPSGPFPPGVSPFYPFLSHESGGRPAQQGSFGHPISPVPLNSFRTPMANGSSVKSKRTTRRVVEDDGYSDSQNQSDFGMQGNDDEDTSTGGRRGKSQKRGRRGSEMDDSSIEAYFEPMLNNLLESFKLTDLDVYKKADGDKELVGRILLAFNLLRRKMTQVEEKRETGAGASRRPDLKSGTMMMTKGIRTNQTKRVGNVPGVEVGDIFFFRMELCLVGMHAPSMAGIDYMSVKLSMDDEPIALSIVSSGGYDDEGEDSDVLIYTGQGGVQRRDGQMFDQKLERGNLALEKSLHRANDVRVIRGVRDYTTTAGKIYVYDGLYKIQESWAEKNKSGCNVFKYKLVRVPGQPEAYTLWKSIQQWKDGVAVRSGVILPDLTSGAESQPVCLVNDVDDEKGPAYFTYIPTLKDPKPFLMPKHSLSCRCTGGCQPGDSNCCCLQKNEGFLPYSALGVLMTYKTLIRECGPSCSCAPNCRNRMSQAGLKVRLEVFKTKNRGWGLRSWDPIRAGGFICEYAGEVIDASRAGEYGSESGDNYIFDATRNYPPLEVVRDSHEESTKIPFALVISAKNGGNVARFMNHSCSPNVFWQPVVRENNNEAYYHIAFFAIKHIPPMQELTFDYGMVPSDKADRRRKKCLCGSANCRGYFY
nr:histone-lysine N-methyltransferase, H3 lysine-9 specific SUVH1-like [Ipomoea batatas]